MSRSTIAKTSDKQEENNEEEEIIESFIDSQKLGSSPIMSEFDSNEIEPLQMSETSCRPPIDEFIAKLSLSMLVDPINAITMVFFFCKQEEALNFSK